MLIESVRMHIKNIHPTVPSVKMANASASYICNYKFQFKFNVKIDICKFL